MKPDEKILSAFNLNRDIIPLAGGQNNSWKTGGFVLKYVAADDLNEWMCSTFEPGDFSKDAKPKNWQPPDRFTAHLQK